MRCSGKFVLRVHPVLHARLRKKSGEWGSSLNQTCLKIIERGLEIRDGSHDRFMLALKNLKKQFRGHLLGLLVFGSHVNQQDFHSSDIDLLVLLDSKIKLSRTLYQIWDDSCDDNLKPVMNPHFVHPPQNQPYGSLWLEAVKKHRVLFDKKSMLQNILDQIHSYVMMGQVSQKISHGQPYWIRS